MMVSSSTKKSGVESRMSFMCSFCFSAAKVLQIIYINEEKHERIRAFLLF